MWIKNCGAQLLTVKLGRSVALIVGALRAFKVWFGSVSRKSTKFGPDVVQTILNEIWVDAKLEFSRNGRNREIQYGRHPEKKVLDFLKT